QQIAYFTVIFVFGPLAVLTGIAMSPAVVNRFSWYARIFGGRQSARSIHFLTMLSFLAFLVVHVTLIVMTGLARNMNHIVMGTDDWRRMAEHGFQDFRLRVSGLVENPAELSLADLERLGVTEHITMHHCIQGWSGIAKWGGLPMEKLIELVRPKPEAKVVAFF